MSTEVYCINEVTKGSHLSAILDDMAISSESLYRMYGSSDWLRSISALDNDIKVLFQKNTEAKIETILPFNKCIKKINLISYKVINIAANLMSADVISCAPLGVISESNYCDMFNALFDRFKDITCIYIKSIFIGSEIYHNLISSSGRSDSTYFCILTSTPRVFHTMSFKESFEEYLAMFNKKERYNLKRQCRLAKDASGGELYIKRIELSQDTNFFASCAKQILNNSWKSNDKEVNRYFSEERCIEYSSLAEKGLLRSYVLLGNGEPWAFVLGYQWEGVFHYSDVAYDDNKANLSPGTVLLYLMLEDLYSYHKPKFLNFGIGSSFYKRRFGTDISYDATLLILKKGIINRALAACINVVIKIKSQIRVVQHSIGR